MFNLCEFLSKIENVVLTLFTDFLKTNWNNFSFIFSTQQILLVAIKWEFYYDMH